MRQEFAVGFLKARPGLPLGFIEGEPALIQNDGAAAEI